jgi:hypothetical protein
MPQIDYQELLQAFSFVQIGNFLLFISITNTPLIVNDEWNHCIRYQSFKDLLIPIENFV